MPYTVKKPFDIARQTRNELLAQLKKNQQELYATLTQTTAPADLFESKDLARSCLEDRCTEVFDLRETVAEMEWAAYLVQTIRVRRHTLERIAKTGLWKRRTKTAFYVSSVKLSAERAAVAIGASKTEITMSAMPPSARIKAASVPIRASSCARLRSIAINILRANNVQNINDALWKNALNPDKTLQLINYN